MCVRAGRLESENYTQFTSKREKIEEKFSACCVASLKSSFVQPLLVCLDLWDDFRTRRTDVQEGGHFLTKFDILFTDSPRARFYRRSVVETCGGGNFERLLGLVNDVVQATPDRTDLTPIFAFGKSINTALLSHQVYAEEPFADFFS